MQFTPKLRLDEMAKNILRKRYLDKSKKETKWRHVAERVNNHVTKNWKSKNDVS